MIKRAIEKKLLKFSKQYPIVMLTGPRQSGKTTICKKVFPKKDYVSLENPDDREFALSDPRGFLGQFEDTVIIDEAQRAPDIFSYIQGIVDEKKKNGMFILTGSQNFQLSNKITQSLAGRTAILKLLPFSMEEISSLIKTVDLNDLLLKGFYPRIYDQKLDPYYASSFYFETYIEKDVRTLIKLKDLSLFQKFVRLCAGRIGQVLNISSLGNEVGVSHTTSREWLSLLEASYIIYLLPPHFNNFNKRITKSPKLYFYDVGLASYLLGVETKKQMQRDPLRGNLFENLIIIELLKVRFNEVKQSNISYYRDNNKNEVDVIITLGNTLLAIEIKSGQTIQRSFFKGLNYFCEIKKSEEVLKAIIYGGDKKQKQSDIHIFPFKRSADVLKIKL